MTNLQADWLLTPFVRAVVDALGPENIKFVGGAVRDTLLGREIADIDAATCHLPQQTTRLLDAAGIKVIPTGLKHGTVTAVLNKDVMEITTLRVDVETDGRHAEVAFTTDWQEDAKRRDFTFNALYLAPDGMLFDPFDGLADLNAGRVRFVGKAVERIEEDALRIMRFFRFFARYGVGQPDVEAMAACTKMRHMLAKLSIERVRDELLKIMALPNPSQPVEAMGQCGVLHEIYGPEFEGRRVEAFLKDEARAGVEINPLLRFYYLAPTSFGAAGIARKFKLSNEERRFLVKYEHLHDHARPRNEKELHQAIYRFGAAVVRVRAIGSDSALYQLTVRVCDTWRVPEMPVKGRDLLTYGIKAGPEMGRQLDVLEQYWIENNFEPTKEALLDLISYS